MTPVPERNATGGGIPYWSDLADSLVWGAGARYDSVFMIGLKAPGAPRGVWHGEPLVDRTTTRALRSLLLQQFGVRTVWADSLHFPQVEVRIPSLELFSRIRRLPFVDYVEPAKLELLPMSSGCGPEPLTQAVITMRAGNGGSDTLSAMMPQMGIPDAWAYSKGDGVLIGVTGQGIDDSPGAPFGPIHFATVDSYGRRAFYQNTNGSGADASPSCDHETRLANLMAAPRDGYGVAGIAYRSGVYSNYFTDSPVVTDEAAASSAIYYTAVYAFAKVMTLAWGTATGSQAISDAIDNAYYNYDVVLVGAAGTCWSGTDDCPGMGSAVFPASKGEVLAASGSNWNGTRPMDNFDWGSKIEGVLAYTRLATVGMGVGSPSELIDL